MQHEIERKFLLSRPLDDVKLLYPAVSPCFISQSYLNKTGDWTTRIRCVRDSLGQVQFYLTLKRKVTDITCIEVEDTISERFYRKLQAQCGPTIHKHRWRFEVGSSIWDVDHFLNQEFDNLVTAEIELTSETQRITKPDWLGEEVTHDKKYKNAKLVRLLNP